MPTPPRWRRNWGSISVALEHVPVLLAEVVEALAVRPGGLYLDATYGAGGHSAALVERGARVLAFDRDPNARVPPALAASLELVHRNFDELARELDERGIERVDGVLFDLGVSSMQLDRAERGFSFQTDAPLDMRMSAGSGPSAADLLAVTSETELADLIYRFGEERASRRIARAIVSAREAGRLPQTTLELARLVAGAVHVRGRRERIHPGDAHLPSVAHRRQRRARRARTRPCRGRRARRRRRRASPSSPFTRSRTAS